MILRLGELKVKPIPTFSKWQMAAHGAALLWYIALFPGRVGIDPILSMRMMRVGESTDWWTSQYFWFLRLTSFNGSSIWFTSFISLLTMYFAFYFFIYSVPAQKNVLDKTLFICTLSPLFGNFSVTVNHDTFFTAGVLLLVGISMRNLLNKQEKISRTALIAATIFLLNSKTGMILICAFLLFLVVAARMTILALGLAALSVILFLGSGIGITKSQVPIQYLPALADIKCVAQHPSARISQSEWQYLSTITSIEKWKIPLTCSNMDIATGVILRKKIEEINAKDFLQNYFSITLKNPAIVIIAHTQRSSIALPPPFFQGPSNQVDTNVQNPVGLDSNIALQQGPGVLHPSIDDPSLKVNLKFLKPLESLFLLPSFLINQASWFWGWGGLWIWVFLIFQIWTLRIRRTSHLIAVSYPLIISHAILILVGPLAVPRYVMSSILIGFTCLIIMLLSWHNQNWGKSS